MMEDFFEQLSMKTSVKLPSEFGCKDGWQGDHKVGMLETSSVSLVWFSGMVKYGYVH